MPVSEPRRLSRARKLAFAAITTLVLLVAVELVLRASGYGKRVVAVPDARVGFRLVPNQDRETPRGQRMRINSHGMRDGEFPMRKPEGEYRVLLLGDSLTFGIDVEQEETFAAQLHRKLREEAAAATPPRSLRVMNAGIQGYDSSNERDWLFNFGFDLAPDLVVVMFYPNDIEFEARKMAVAEFPGRDLMRRTATFEWLEKKYFERESRRLGESGEADDLKSQQFRDLLKRYTGKTSANPNDDQTKTNTIVARGILFEMADACAKRRMKFAVALIPAFANTLDPALPNIMGGMSYDLKERKIEHVNLIDALKGHHPDCWLAWDEGHLSPLGHQLVAGAMESWLVERQLVPR